MQPDDPGETAMGADEPLSRQPEHAALVAIGTNLILTIFKFLLASLTRSLALLAEAFHSFSDIGSSFMVFLVLRAERVNDLAARDGTILHESSCTGISGIVLPGKERLPDAAFSLRTSGTCTDRPVPVAVPHRVCCASSSGHLRSASRARCNSHSCLETLLRRFSARAAVRPSG
jgi:hypothetical protein